MNNGEMSVIALIAEASLLVQLVMLILLLASVASWAVMIRKHRMLGDAEEAASRFEQAFWAGGDLSELYRDLTEQPEGMEGMEAIFEAGFAEFAEGRRRPGQSATDAVESARRSMRIVHMREIDRLEGNLAFLATVGSTSPYIGLFGTVWGIMNSFRALGAVQQATLSMVAPGIAEALIATAMGLAAAIPAVIGYNRFADKVERLETRFDTFVEEFCSILERNAHAE
ncbi:protein TolQ [Natronospira bacteriovora]|uniref:Tol-Pal system protein TolQ n=1 Tax=Natronospira bacteriovora TaxID=3069753 RepID=A0ABU0W3C1_9GAMM|nr:protein TolQ [Natronospira sp. AB-CW4]MDQ2068510.1 protein TolQ [Natronospira sp. AB-CW4]